MVALTIALALPLPIDVASWDAVTNMEFSELVVIRAAPASWRAYPVLHAQDVLAPVVMGAPHVF